MIALKLLLTIAGALMLAAAAGIPLFGLWLRMKWMRRKTAADESGANESGTNESGPDESMEEAVKAPPPPIAWLSLIHI